MANDILISLIIIIIIRLTSKRYYNSVWQKLSIILQNKKNTDKRKGVIFPLTIGSDNLARFSEEEDTIRRRDIELKTLRSVLHQFRHQVQYRRGYTGVEKPQFKCTQEDRSVCWVTDCICQGAF